MTHADRDCATWLDTAAEVYQTLSAYRVSLHATHGDKAEIIRYFFKKPGYVRMEFTAPLSGAVLIYSPITRQARLWPFGHRRFPSMSLSPDNPLIQSPAGQRVDRSDIGALYRHVRSVLEHGHGEVIGVEEIDDRPVWHLQVSTAAGFSLGPVTRYELWLDEARALPLLVRSYGKDHGVIEAVGMSDWQIDPVIPENLFDV